MTFRWLALAALIAGLPATAPAQTVVDGDFQSWTLRSLPNPPEHSECASITREPAAGNPGAHLRIAIVLAGTCGEGRGLAIFEGFSSTAPLDELSYTFTVDARL